MSNPGLLFRICKAHASWAVVSAYSLDHAKQLAHRLDDSIYDDKPTYEVTPIRDIDDIPKHWRTARPVSDPEVTESDLRTCAQYFPTLFPPLDPHEQHAQNQLLHGSMILRPPRNRTEEELYHRFDVQRTPDMIYFTLLKPFPPELKPMLVCYAIRPDAFPK